MYVVTDHNEELKVREKSEACERCLQGRATFLAVVCNTHGGLGRMAYAWLRDAFQRKVDEATNDGAKRAARLELETSLAEIGCAVLVRNSMILAANARGQASGGAAPSAGNNPESEAAQQKLAAVSAVLLAGTIVQAIAPCGGAFYWLGAGGPIFVLAVSPRNNLQLLVIDGPILRDSLCFQGVGLWHAQGTIAAHVVHAATPGFVYAAGDIKW
jgi:hypothetical protein